ncbi:MAG: AAA family ATPase [Gammaproteobacteria bacterium]|nr:AAA family ATPase [Gammaproteobacteria bacterium]
MERRTLPIGIQTFSILREEGCYYVDKTPLIRELIRTGRHYFLSRPRRFGKSLLVDTLQELFEGNEPLFQGLDIHPYWDWSVKHPVVRLSFGGDIDTPEEIQNHVLNQLYKIEQAYDLKTFPSVHSAAGRLENVLYFLHQATGQRAVVLVDEYDRPVLNVLEDREKARANRNKLRNLYSILKDAEKHIRFVFVTGITMFSKTSFSSGLNNLTDISLYPRYATICGYTDQDLDTVFAPELEGLDRDKIRTWYNGYNWLGTEKLYNPHDILHLFDVHEFRAYWFKSGVPGYLYRLLEDNQVSPMQLENRVVDADFVTNFELGEFTHEALLFQSGYLTIKKKEVRKDNILYHLEYPNYEVQRSFNAGLAEHLTKRGKEVAVTGEDLIQALGENNFSAFMEKIQDLLSEFPHTWHDTANPGDYESWYASLLHMCFRTTQVDLKAEEITKHGRSDMVLLHEGQVFVLELKMVENKAGLEKGLDSAIAQIREKGYARKYRSRGEPICLIGMVFGKKERDLLDIRVEKF